VYHIVEVIDDVVLRENRTLDLECLRSWAKEYLAFYKIPSRLLIVDALPRNAMGKVTKPVIVEMFHG
jgi:malonyl-CoA/methylmalonyl-CoA synthetase